MTEIGKTTLEPTPTAIEIKGPLDIGPDAGQRRSVRVATVVAGTSSSDFEAGDTIDGIVLAVGDRILIKDQGAGVENGVFVVRANGAPQRATDYDIGFGAASSYMFVQEGTVNADTGWLCTNDTGSDIVGTDALVYTAFSSGPTTPGAGDVRIFKDVQSAGTAGGTFTSGSWTTRRLNTSTGNLTGTALAGNRFTLPAGNYLIEATAPAYNVDVHQCRIQNITDATTEFYGATSETVAFSGSACQTVSVAIGYVSIAAAKSFELQHQCALTRATDGLGRPGGFTVSSVGEVYAMVKVLKTN